MYLVLRIAAILVEITFSDMHVCANCLQVIMNLLRTCFTVISTPYIAVISKCAALIECRRSTSTTLVQMFPGQSEWWILPGTKSCLNLAGKSVARCGMCRSPMQSTSTMLCGPQPVMDQACAAVNWSLNLRCESDTRTFRRNTNPMLAR